jgi:hypothetical protein
MRFPSIRISICVALVALASAAHADIYRCVGADGNTSYSDTPCARDAKSKSNITENVGACTTAQCEEQRRQQADEARQRVRSEKEELADLVNKRRQLDADAARERAQLEELRYRRAIEERLSSMADQAAQATNNSYYEYPGYPVYPVVVRPCGRHCNTHLPHKPDLTKKAKEPSVSIRLDR